MRRQCSVWFSCQHISADCRLTQSAEMTAWAVEQVPASRVYAYFCTSLLGIVCKSEPLGCRSCQSDIQLIPADYRLTQSAEMIPWVVHHVEAVSTCQTDSVLVSVSV